MKRIHLKFQHRLIWYNFIIFMIIFLVAGGVFFYNSAMDLNRQASQDFETLANKTTMQLNTLIYNMDKTAVQIAANPSVVRWFSGIPEVHPGNYFVEEPVISHNVVQLLNSYNFKKDGNSRILLYNDHGDFVYSAMTMTTMEPINQYLKSEEFHRIQQYFQEGEVYSYFCPPQEDTLNDSGLPSPAFFAVVRQIKDYSQNSLKCGYVEVQQSVAQIDEIFGDIGSGCYAVILDEAETIVYRSPGMREKEYLHDAVVREAAHGDGDWRSWSGEISEAPVTVLFFMETRSLNQALLQFGLVLLAALLSMMVVTVISEFFLVRRLSRPLVELQQSIKEVRLENLHFDLQNESDSDELQQLTAAFNKMLRQLRTEIDCRIISETNELKSHLFALQSQMNPHFIHNLLAIVSMEATMDDNQKIVTICSRLAKMLTFSSNMGNGFCSLSEETEHANNYLQLMKVRYEDRFEYEILIPEEAKEIEVPKLIVQPLCENSFTHAFKHCRRIWRIKIEAHVDEGGWQVMVQDNGPGFPEEFLEKCGEFVETATVENTRNLLEHLSIGGLSIPNIYMRMKLAYGEEASFVIENLREGAKITIGRRYGHHDKSSGG